MEYNWYFYCAGGIGGSAIAETETEYQDAADVAYAHKFDNGVIQIITPPEKDVTVEISGYTVTFFVNGGWEIK